MENKEVFEILKIISDRIKKTSERCSDNVPDKYADAIMVELLALQNKIIREFVLYPMVTEEDLKKMLNK